MYAIVQSLTLQRFVLATEKDRVHDRARPALYCFLIFCYCYRDKLTTADAIRRWIPRIKGDMDYCIQQVIGS